jgi:plasmid stabilization system protein ParE
VTKPFRIESEATAELQHASQWYEDRRDGLGDDLLIAIDESLALIQRWPSVGSLVPRLPRDLHIRRVPVRRFPYHVVYLETDTAIRILAVAHDHRQPGVMVATNLACWSSAVSRAK